MIRAINCIFLIFALIFIFQKTEKEHYYNWDAIPYSMGLHIYEGRSVDEAHYLTYYNLREDLPQLKKIVLSLTLRGVGLKIFMSTPSGTTFTLQSTTASVIPFAH